MKRIKIIIPYFGKLPKNIITFLISCKYNKSIQWLIYTDDSLYKKLNNFCKNVTFVKGTLSWIKRRLHKVTGLQKIVLDRPYKLCDYKPLYGLIFSKYLKGYDYWGYSDLDVVYGNLMKYIKYGIDHNFDKIGVLGHFTLIKNKSYVNNRYKLPITKNGKKVFLFRDIVSRTFHECAFDEFNGMDVIYDQYKIPTYTNPHLVNEIIFSNLDLNTLNEDKYKTHNSCYVWNNGRDEFFYTHFGKIKECDYGYFHFQKRRLFNKFILNSNEKMFSITTYGYNKLSSLNKKNIRYAMKQNKSSLYKRLKYKCHIYFFTNTFATRMRIGNVRLPIKHFLKNIFVRRDFRMFKI